MLTSAELRQRFLEFFRAKDHEVVPSASLVPANDPTLLFTNAGMVPFKDVFLGQQQRAIPRAASSQRCVRAGGKHNDLENVGYTARHHTFFEMLGNFSFGDYFKLSAIDYAWEFLTVEMKLAPERLWVTVFEEDDEAADIWLKKIKVSPKRFARIGASDNFWSMGDTGPCGPCSEIFYDHGPDVSGGPPGSADADGDRYVEIWNLVFMQFDRSIEGVMNPLPKPSVDTGMGLERLAAVMQGVHNNFDIDLFKGLVDAAGELAGIKDHENNSLRVIADHIRSCAFLVVDGVLPSNERRGYVLRRIIRRAVRHGYRLGITEPFFFKLVEPLKESMGEAYPELSQAQEQVERVLRQEEERFSETLEQGMKILSEDVMGLSSKTIPGDVIFKLYDTYGFPVDLTADIAREQGLVMDMEGFEKEMDGQRERARAASHFGAAYSGGVEVEGSTEFTGYERLEDRSKVLGLFCENKPVKELASGQKGMVVLDRTPFYGESGGQVGDRGELEKSGVQFSVEDTQNQGDGVVMHVGVLKQGTLREGDTVTAKVDKARRRATVRNHSATHLLHAALRKVLGEHVQQKGSLVAPEYLRFDFSHFEPISLEQLEAIERLVNEKIRGNAAAVTRVMPMDDAIEVGAMALFGEKYGDDVRVLSIGEFSVELCGGTHVRRAGDIGVLKITSESGIASGVRRIEAVSGAVAWNHVEQSQRNLRHIADLVKSVPDEAGQKVGQLLDKNRKLTKELEQLKSKLASDQGGDLAAQAVDVAGIKVIAARIDGADAKALRETVDQLKNKLGSAAVVLGAADGDKVRLVAGVTKDQQGKVKAGDLVNAVASQVGGRGGGRPDMAQAGGDNPAALDSALSSVPGWVKEQVKG